MAKSRTTAEPKGNGVAVAEPVPSPGRNDAAPRIEIPGPDIQWIDVKVIGDAPLICNAFPDKIKQMMIDDRRTDTKVKKKRPVRDFHQEYLDSLYPLPDGSGYGFPAIAFKRGMVGACRMVDGLAMTTANRIIYVESDMTSKGAGVVRIKGKPSMREDMVRLKGQDRPPDIRYRAEFKEWTCTLRIRFIASILSAAQIYNLVQWAGITEGVGEYRPSSPDKSGDCGVYHPEHSGDKK